MSQDIRHLDALIARLGRESTRLAAATAEHERKFRQTQVAQCQREINGEWEFLNLSDEFGTTDDELLALLGIQS